MCVSERERERQRERENEREVMRIKCERHKPLVYLSNLVLTHQQFLLISEASRRQGVLLYLFMAISSFYYFLFKYNFLCQ